MGHLRLLVVYLKDVGELPMRAKGKTMLKKLITGALVGVAALAMAMPAGAATTIRTARLANNSGLVTFTQTKQGWELRATANLWPGQYVVGLTAEYTVNGAVGGSAGSGVCLITVKQHAKVGTCHARGEGFAPNWAAPYAPDTYIVGISEYSESAGFGTTVYGPVTLH